MLAMVISLWSGNWLGIWSWLAFLHLKFPTMYYSATFATFLCLNRDLFVLTVSNNILAAKELSSAFFLQGTQYGQ